MAAGIIPIVMKNPAEEYILFQSLIKFVCNDEQEYIHNIELLYRERSKRSSIIDFMQEHVTKLYDSKKMVASWEEVFNNLKRKEKRLRSWVGLTEEMKNNGYRIFIESLGDYGKIFEDNVISEIRNLSNLSLQWRSVSKGSPKQYLEAFPNDKLLKEWVDLIG
jgi:hypothetical protein